MGTKHKHAELIKAWADGAIIQYKSISGDWCDTTYNNPAWDIRYEYRIKPAPKPDYVIKGQACWCEETDKIGEYFGESVAINITFDGETNKPKAVELIK